MITTVDGSLLENESTRGESVRERERGRGARRTRNTNAIDYSTSSQSPRGLAEQKRRGVDDAAVAKQAQRVINDEHNLCKVYDTREVECGACVRTKENENVVRIAWVSMKMT